MSEGAAAGAAAEPVAFPADLTGYTLGKKIASPREGLEYWTATTTVGEENVIIQQISDDLLFSDANDEQESYDYAARALRLACLLKYEGVWRHHTAFMSEAQLWIVQPRSEGTLHDIVVRLGRRRFSELTIAHITKKLLQSLDYFHRTGYIHRAVSSHSITLDRDGTVRLCRLQHAVPRHAPGSATASHAFSRDELQIPWAAPELLRQDLLGYTEKIDVYSVGVLVLELLLGRHPYYGMLPTEILLLKLQDERGPLGLVQSYLQLSRSCSDFLRACLHEDDFSRPSAKQLLTMGFIRQSRRVPPELSTALASLPTFESAEFECPGREISEVESRYHELVERWRMDVTRHAFPSMHSTGLRYVPLEGRLVEGWSVGDVRDEADDADHDQDATLRRSDILDSAQDEELEDEADETLRTRKSSAATVVSEDATDTELAPTSDDENVPATVTVPTVEISHAVEAAGENAESLSAGNAAPEQSDRDPPQHSISTDDSMDSTPKE